MLTIFSALSFSLPASDLTAREQDLANRKTELSQVSQQLSTLQPTVTDLIQKRAALDAEYKSVTDKRNELALELNQLRAVYETESQILVDTENTLVRERQLVNICMAELQQAQQTVSTIQSEKNNLSHQLTQTREEIDEIKKQIATYNESSIPLRGEIEQLKNEVRQLVQNREINEQLLQSARRDYEVLKGDVLAEQQRLEGEKQRSVQLQQQVAVQRGINEREREKLGDVVRERERVARENEEKVKEVGKMQAQKASSMPLLNDPYAAFSELSDTKSNAETNAKSNGMVVDTTVAKSQGLSGSPTTSATIKKAPPPPPPLGKKPTRGELVGSPITGTKSVDALSLGNSQQGETDKGQDPKPKARTTKERTNSVSSVMSLGNMSATTNKSAKEEFDQFFEMHKPKNGKGVSPSSGILPVAGGSPIASSPQLQPQRPASPALSIKSEKNTNVNVNSPAMSTPKRPGSAKSLSLGFEKRDRGDDKGSVRSLPLMEDVGKEKETKKEGGDVMKSQAFEVDFDSAFGGDKATEQEQFMGGARVTENGGEKEKNGIPSTQPGNTAETTQPKENSSNSIPKPSLEPENPISLTPPTFPSTENIRKFSTTSTRSSTTKRPDLFSGVDFDRVMNSAFEVSPDKGKEKGKEAGDMNINPNPSMNTNTKTDDFDATFDTFKGDFEEGFRFDASFDATNNNHTATTGFDGEVDFESAFGGLPTPASVPSTTTNTADPFGAFDSVFGGNVTQVVASPGVEGFDDAFGGSFGGVSEIHGEGFGDDDGFGKTMKTVEKNNKRSDTVRTDDADEVKEIVGAGFTKGMGKGITMGCC